MTTPKISLTSYVYFESKGFVISLRSRGHLWQSLCIYLKCMHQAQRLTSTSVQNVHVCAMEPLAPINRIAKDSSRRHKTFVCISKSALRDFVMGMKSVYFITMQFGCICSLFKPRAFCSALFFSDLNIKA